MTRALALACLLCAGARAQTISGHPASGVGITTGTATLPGTAPGTTAPPTGPQVAPPIQQPTAPAGFSRPGANFTTPTAPFIGVSTPPFHQTPLTPPAKTTSPAITAPAATAPQTRAVPIKSSRNDWKRPIRDFEAAEKGGSAT